MNDKPLYHNAEVDKWFNRYLDGIKERDDLKAALEIEKEQRRKLEGALDAKDAEIERLNRECDRNDGINLDLIKERDDLKAKLTDKSTICAMLDESKQHFELECERLKAKLKAAEDQSTENARVFDELSTGYLARAEAADLLIELLVDSIDDRGPACNSQLNALRQGRAYLAAKATAGKGGGHG